ncbi:uncharacterized protein BJ212DRAFT_369094 [Suillus subaureus]|uniref:Secreted protein n=1 Tax=Suillus subaureus TaxID=48587 RepID=A0A9P7E8V6_9AGAM|nr:uncharacterized protein BJ212DRAFT_369094 [Suillus subaureus]KAG1814388.1 hypothetical protein BJ212DRAFT_369094 [Suillus subaureus]
MSPWSAMILRGFPFLMTTFCFARACRHRGSLPTSCKLCPEEAYPSRVCQIPSVAYALHLMRLCLHVVSILSNFCCSLSPVYVPLGLY